MRSSLPPEFLIREPDPLPDSASHAFGVVPALLCPDELDAEIPQLPSVSSAHSGLPDHRMAGFPCPHGLDLEPHDRRPRSVMFEVA